MRLAFEEAKIMLEMRFKFQEMGRKDMRMPTRIADEVNWANIRIWQEWTGCGICEIGLVAEGIRVLPTASR